MGFEPMIPKNKYVDFQDQCFKPLSHSKNRIIRIEGLEPSWLKNHWGLNSTCLPIPPYPYFLEDGIRTHDTQKQVYWFSKSAL